MVKIKKSISTAVFVLTALVSVSLLFFSCQQTAGVPIPLPKDTSALGRINHFIPLDQLETLKKDFLPQQESISKNVPGLYIPVSEAFNKAALLDLLKDSANVGIRIYYGVKKGDNRNEFRMILVGVDQRGNDLYLTKGSALATKIGGDTRGGLEFGQCNPPCH
jgi:hypothetical protein